MWRPDNIGPALFISKNWILGKVLVCFLRILSQPVSIYTLGLLESETVFLCLVEEESITLLMCPLLYKGLVSIMLCARHFAVGAYSVSRCTLICLEPGTLRFCLMLLGTY